MLNMTYTQKTINDIIDRKVEEKVRKELSKILFEISSKLSDDEIYKMENTIIHNS